MSCYHPLVREPLYEDVWVPVVDGGEEISRVREQRFRCDENGQIKFKIRGLLKEEYEWIQKLNFEVEPSEFGKLFGEFRQLIPCGHCIGCQLDRSRQWADRMLCELQSAQGKGIFVTLTYAPENVPFSWYKDNQDCLHRSYTLKKDDLQAFNKRLRRRFDGSGDYPEPERRIRFYGAGEYGEMTLRPHYHEIFFGIDLDDVGAVPAVNAAGQVVKNELGHVYYRSELLEKLWPFGLVSCSEVSWRTCAYVARYVTKKWQSGYKTNEIYQFFGVIPEFSLMSRRPGIGAEFFDNWTISHTDMDLLDVYKFSLCDQEGVKQIKLPKYIKKKLKDDPFMAEKYKLYSEHVKAAQESRVALQLEKTDLDYLSLLEVSERNHKSIMFALSRDKV